MKQQCFILEASLMHNMSSSSCALHQHRYTKKKKGRAKLLTACSCFVKIIDEQIDGNFDLSDEQLDDSLVPRHLKQKYAYDPVKRMKKKKLRKLMGKNQGT